MAVKPHSIDIVVADMPKALAFYRTLGLDCPDGVGQDQVQVETPGGTSLGFLTEAIVRQAMPHWVTPIGQRVTFACHCDSAEELDETYASVTAAGYVGLKAPWDTNWGQRYAFLQDPDGNRVDIFTEL